METENCNHYFYLSIDGYLKEKIMLVAQYKSLHRYVAQSQGFYDVTK